MLGWVVTGLRDQWVGAGRVYCTCGLGVVGFSRGALTLGGGSSRGPCRSPEGRRRRHRRARDEASSSPTLDPGFDLTHLWAPAPASSPTAAASVGGTRASPPCVATSPLPASRRPPPPETARSATPTIPARGDKAWNTRT
ncbi:unnamed protein product [Urochloa humidicola]